MGQLVSLVEYNQTATYNIKFIWCNLCARPIIDSYRFRIYTLVEIHKFGNSLMVFVSSEEFVGERTSYLLVVAASY